MYESRHRLVHLMRYVPRILARRLPSRYAKNTDWSQTRPKAGSPLASRVGSSKVAAASTAAASTGAWIGLKKLPMLLNKGAGAIGPLKAVVDEFIECMDICEVSISV